MLSQKTLNLISDIIKSLLDLVRTLKPMLPSPPPKEDEHWKSLADKLYDAAYAAIGTDVSPDDVAADKYGCVESVSKIIQQAFPSEFFPTLVSTVQLYNLFNESAKWKKIAAPEKGCIMLAVTGFGNGSVPNGHVAIVGRNMSPDGTNWAMSNNSTTGTWEPNYSVGSFTRFFKGKGGYQVWFYRRV